MKKNNSTLLVVVTLAFTLASCAAPTAAPTLIPTQLPPPIGPGQLGQPEPLPQPPDGQPQLPNPPLPPPMPSGTSQPQASTPTVEATAQNAAFQFIRTVKITPDEHFSIGEGGVIHYVSATDRLVAIVQTKVDHPVTLSTSEVCAGKVIGYVEYTTDMQPTGKYGYLACGMADERSRIIGNDLYLSKMYVKPGESGSKNGQVGWMLEKFDATTWKELASTFVKLDYPDEQDAGPDISFINGQIVVTSQYSSGGQIFNGTHNHLFTTDLEPVGKRLLTAPEYPPHFCEVSMLQLSNGDILLFASNSPKGDLIVLRLDRNWKFLEQKVLRKNAYFPTGSIADGPYLYIAYTDTSTAEVALAGQNDRLAAYDAQWNLVQDVALTNVQTTPSAFDYGENPWIELHGNRLYAAYLISKLDPDTHALIDTQMYVNIYELTQ